MSKWRFLPSNDCWQQADLHGSWAYLVMGENTDRVCNKEIMTTRLATKILLAAFAAILAWFPTAAVADGKVFSRAVEANPTIPDQRALIHFAEGIERLVIETSFVGQGTNFAWVVPVPAIPKIEEVSPRVFPMLQLVFQPKIIHDVKPFFLAFLILIGVIAVPIWALRIARLRGIAILAGGPLLFILIFFIGSLAEVPPLFLLSLFGAGAIGFLIWAWRVAGFRGIALAILGFLAMLLLIPNFVKARGGGSSAQLAVEVLDRKTVGVYDTATISSKDAGALIQWLNANGFAASTNIAPVVADYVRQGWVFVAARVRRETDSKKASMPHPLAFTFKTLQPVYPLRLTGIDNDACRIDLYVFGPERAEIPGFEVQRCSRTEYSPGETTRNDAPAKPGAQAVRVLQPALLELVEKSPTATKLSAKLSTADMQTDAYIAWVPFQPTGEFFYSTEAAGTRAANVFVPLAVLGLLLVRFCAGRPGLALRKPAIFYCCVLMLSACGAGWFFWAQPKKEVRMIYGVNACIANLKQLDGAIQQWALENKKMASDTVTINDIRGYLNRSLLPVCPMDGHYEVTTAGESPTCSIPGHYLE